MIKFKDREVIIIDVDLSTEEITVQFRSDVEAQVAFDELSGPVSEVSNEFERIRRIRQCLATITEEIKPTDGTKGSLLAIIRDRCWQA